MKKVLSLLLVLTMVFALAVPALAEEAEKEVFHYVSLGASNSNGYALHGYLTEDMYANPVLSGAQTGTPGDISGYRSTPEGSYPALVRDYYAAKGYTVDHDQLAQSSMRVEELRFLLDPEFTTDSYMEWRFYDPNDSWTWWYSNLDALREDYKQSITEADLITYDMGMNNFGVYLTNNLLSKSYDNDLHYVVPDEYADMFYELRGKLESAIASLGIDESLFATLDDLTDTIAYALLGYCINFDATIGIIRDWNPDATVVVLNVQNIMAGLKASLSGIVLPLGDIIGAATKIANTYTSVLSPYAGQYLYADVTQNGRVTCFMDQLLEYNGDPATLDQDMRECLDVYDTSLPMYLKYRIAAKLAANMGDELAQKATTRKSKELKNNLPYFVEYCEKNCPEIFAAATENGYDTIMTLLQKALATNPVSADGLLGGANMGKLEDILVDGIMDVINKVADANFNGEGFTDEDIDNVIDALLDNDDIKTVAAIGVRASIGNTFFSHPNRQGCRELYDAIINAIENDISASDAFAGQVETTANEVLTGAVEFATQIPKLIVTKVADAVGLDSEAVGKAADKLLDTETIVSVIFKESGIRTSNDVKKIENAISSVAEKIQKSAAAARNLVKVAAKNATLLKEGNIEYYVDQKTGEMFYDALGLNKIDDQGSVVVPKLSVVSAVKGLFKK